MSPLFGFRPDTHGRIIFIDVDMDDIRAAADRAVFDILLTQTAGRVDGNDDFLAAGIADIGGFVSHVVSIRGATLRIEVPAFSQCGDAVGDALLVDSLREIVVPFDAVDVNRQRSRKSHVTHDLKDPHEVHGTSVT